MMTSRLEEVAVSIAANNDKLFKLYRDIQNPAYFIRAAIGERSEKEIDMVLDRMISINKVLEDIVAWTKKYILFGKPYISIFQIEMDMLTHNDARKCDELFAYLNVHMANKVSCDSIGEHLHMSSSSLHRNINRIFNMSPYQVVTKYKMCYARYLIHEKSAPVKEAMAACGFTSPSLFARTYSQYFGVLPSHDSARY